MSELNIKEKANAYDFVFNKAKQLLSKCKRVSNKASINIFIYLASPIDTLKQFPKNPSSYFLDYCTKKTLNHLGMDKKPLVPYNPNHTRSQLPNDISFRVIRNYSVFEIGNEGLVNRKQWLSTYKDSYRPSSVKRISNPGILSDLAKRKHYKLNNIEYA